FDEVWVNSEDDAFAEIAEAEGVRFHKRPSDLANNVATSEQYIYQFLKTHDCERVFQVHSIAPLLTTEQVKGFVKEMIDGEYDVLLSCTHEQIECAYRGEPVNFTFAEKTNSQDLDPIQRVTWSITGWKSAPYIEAFEAGKTATYAGKKIGFYPVDRLAGHIIKTEEDLRIAEALLQASSPS
ncbi:MAG: cytidyltransferase, partial [Candidatus Omnitrophica bacterium]|nr:cytidyltransferase [Candidatus Omnitrophota bacterium]